MAADDVELKNRHVWMEGDYASKPVNLKNARVVEGMSTLSETTIEFLSSNDALDMQDMLGKTIHLGLKDGDNKDRFFTGTCTSVEYVGLYQGLSHFVAELRPWLWFLTRTQENRIFQDLTVVEIIQQVLEAYGFWSDVEKKLSASYKTRVYCVQYRESDFTFISRLMEEEGIYYYFIQDGKKLKMVLADSISAHKPTPGTSEFEFFFKESEYRRRQDHIFDFNEATGVTTGKITLNDYNFEAPKADMRTVKAIPKGQHKHKSYEFYRYPGHSRIDGTGDEFTKIRMEAEAVRHKLSRGVANVRTLGVGQTFKMKGHPRKHNNNEYLCTRAVHHLQIETDYEDTETKKPLFESKLPVDEDNKDTYRIVFDVIPKTEPYRAPQDTPWPVDMGMHTAVVTGPSSEEIYTDKYGRIKVQFHWDRLGKKDEKTTCWVRCVMPWTGKNWGMISIPRIGQEVVIQFEEGDPDRPICTGMLYNTDTMPPYALPENMTQTGIKTRSSKQGGSDNFNELVFEDKKDDEFVRLQSEKNYREIIKNNAEITIGIEKQDPGDLTQTIYHTKTETIQTGDHIFAVETGNQEVFVKTDHTARIEGKSSTTIVGDTSMLVETGSYTQTISTGDVAREVSSGGESVVVSLGDYTLDTSAGSVAITAGTEISLTVGANSIVIDQSGITISGTMVTIEGSATLDASAPMTTVSADGVLTLEGGVTMIN
ncbi:type VI secretion system tip protein TssI/VgrG [Tateyamaria sp. ANG-S1]|uniref:type VI secretion system Vgr family protein n=1 Tax=Tateyamaria sp. ANG-S1 TaxID=1577905 RepID=UPI00057ED8F0|nr:type VI secretion system tip protein TssI/VgrG [Tateyamaria sp. ANG-S1]KIC47734.1 type IV secretion protein Rhs [Tateyamaria sp. ANG-S1]